MRIPTLITPVAVAVTAGALVLAGCGSSGGGGAATSAANNGGGSSSSNNAGGLGGGGSTSSSNGGGGSTPTYTIGFIGALSGAEAQLGINEKQGAELAIAQANASGKYKFKIALDAQDSEGDPTKAPAAESALVSSTNPQVIATIGPAFSGESLAVNGKFCGATPPMPLITASASNATLEDQHWACWHRIIADDNVEGSQGADWLARSGAKKVYVLNDLSAYGKGVADTMAAELQKKGVKVVTGGADATTTKNYGPVAQQIVASGADAMFYGGYDAQAALLAKALKAANFNGRMVSGNGSLDTTFTKNAGQAGYGWYFTCGCQDPTKAPQSKAFIAAYKKMFNEDPSTYSPEAYDAANVYIDVINKIVSSGGTPSRTTILAGLKTVNYQGITADIKFEANGEVAPQNLKVNLFEDKNGKDVGLGDINTLK